MLTHPARGRSPQPLVAAVASQAEGSRSPWRNWRWPSRDGASAALVPDAASGGRAVADGPAVGQERMLLETAAVAGQEFDIDPVLAVCGLTAWPDGFTGAGLLTEVRDGRAALPPLADPRGGLRGHRLVTAAHLHRELARTLAACGGMCKP